jgi:hypothetical protein
MFWRGLTKVFVLLQVGKQWLGIQSLWTRVAVLSSHNLCFDVALQKSLFYYRLASSGSGSSLSELQFLAASRRAAAAAAGAVLPPGAGGAAGATGGGVAVPPPPPPHHPPGPDFHPAYRLNPYMEHLYSSLQQHSGPAASIHGQYRAVIN